MFLYQNRLLKANLLNGIMECQQRMTDLYTVNLNSLGTMAALVAGVVYGAVGTIYIQPIVSQSWVSFWYNLLFAISIASAMIMVSHTILASMLGPTKSLVGESSDAVHVAVRDMRHEQELGIIMAYIVLACLFCGAALQAYDNYELYISIPVCTIYVVGFILFSWVCLYTFRVFQLNYNISVLHLAKDRDLEADIGTLDDDMSNLAFNTRGYNVLNEDIMALVEQVRPIYNKGKEIEAHNIEIELLRRKLISAHGSSESYPTPLQLLFSGLPFVGRAKKKVETTTKK